MSDSDYSAGSDSETETAYKKPTFDDSDNEEDKPKKPLIIGQKIDVDGYISGEDDEDDDEYIDEDDMPEEQKIAGKYPDDDADDENVVEDDEDDEEDEEDEDENYLKKFDRAVISDYVDIYHPESRMHNYEEVKALTHVIRNSDNVIVDKLHRTLPFITKFELTKIIGLRAKQLDEGAQALVVISREIISGYNIALMEIQQKKIPFIIRRPIPNGGSEYWKVADLELI